LATISTAIKPGITALTAPIGFNQLKDPSKSLPATATLAAQFIMTAAAALTAPLE